MIIRLTPLALLFCAPAMAQHDPVVTRPMDSSPVDTGNGRISLETRTTLRCSAAFAIVAQRQALGDAAALGYPTLAKRGREFFVRSSAYAMDTGRLDRGAVAAALQEEAAMLLAAGNSGDDAQLDEVMQPCLLLLEASGI
ncbi:hypothetical protein GRI44_13640 [Altererythrobacter confluentis]|uniref:Uncharacterized protein n=1 Tax=Allopontixanthobacter confluentis TaxID=1849021 RepID=A0A6L7GIG6_9SPHN|nr:hypothetical protein [Allopontixanthobacter confluentis]MXP15792.1 hypothetical protein [Allopontixanthobacter confluentis]